MKISLFAAVAATALLTSPALARDPNFVSPQQSHAFEILPTPPAADSDATKAELSELHQLEVSRSQAQAAAAQWDDDNENVFLFKSVFGEKFTKENLPALDAFAARVRSDEGLNSGVAKEGFHRVRPYNLDKTLHPICKTKTKDDSYPSGHTTSGYLLGLTLIDIAPEKRDAILARADEYAHNRLVCGVHYRSDLPASKLVAYSVHAIMEVNPQYQKELVDAKAEVRRVLGLDAQATK